MKLVQMIENEFKKILWIGLAISISGITVFSLFSTKDTLDRANTFIESHIVSLVAKEVSLQNTSEIDSRIRQVYQSWKSTQGTELRIFIYVDGRLVSQAGPLKSFGYFSFVTAKNLDLSSGHSINYRAEIDLSYLVIFFALTTFFVIVFLMLCFWQLRKRMRSSLKSVAKPLEERADWILKKANTLPDSLHDTTTFPESQVQEIAALDESFSIFQNRMIDLEEKLRAKTFVEAKVELAEQVAHSLKGAIAHLSLLAKNADSSQGIGTDLDSIQKNLVNVSESLLQQEKPFSKLLSDKKSVFDAGMVIKKIVADKRNLHRTKQFQFQQTRGNFKIEGSQTDFEISISDLIDNSVQATGVNGLIQVSISQNQGQLEIVIADNGKGISEEIIPQLMRPKASFGKIGGTGLGLFHAKQTVESFSGKIEIKSQLTKGTEVKLIVPLVAQEKLVSLTEGQSLVIVDDDKSIHDCWDLLVFQHQDKIRVRHFYSSSEFQKWMTAKHSENANAVYIFDYDLKEHLNGIDLIKIFSLTDRAKLMTGVSKDPHVQQQAQEMDLVVWDKDEFSNIRIEFKPQNTPHLAVNT